MRDSRANFCFLDVTDERRGTQMLELNNLVLLTYLQRTQLDKSLLHRSITRF